VFEFLHFIIFFNVGLKGIMSVVRDALLNPEGTKTPKFVESTTYYMHASSTDDPKVKKFKQLILSWINSYLREDKVYARDLAADLHDGQLLVTLVEKLMGDQITNLTVGVMSEKSKYGNLVAVSKFLADKIGIVLDEQSIDGILKKDFVSVAKLLVLLAHEFKCPYQLPSNVEVVIVHREKLSTGGVSSKTSRHVITGDETAYGNNDAAAEPEEKYDDGSERDVFDDLFEPGSEAKLETVKKLLLGFVNKHLTKMGVTISNVANQFHDGVYLIMLIGSLGNFFVPLYNYNISPTTTEMKVQNVAFAFKLMDTLEIKRRNWNPADVVRQDLKTVLRVIYTLFQTYKNAPA